jgi:hypothetical protein
MIVIQLFVDRTKIAVNYEFKDYLDFEHFTTAFRQHKFKRWFCTQKQIKLFVFKIYYIKNKSDSFVMTNSNNKHEQSKLPYKHTCNL